MPSRQYVPTRHCLANLAKTASDLEEFAGDPGAVSRREKADGGCDVTGLADATQRRFRDRLLLKIASQHSDRVRAFSLNYPRVDRIDTNLSWPKLLRQHLRDCIDGSFSGRVDHRRRWCDRSNRRSDIDDAATFRTKIFQR